MGQHRLTLSLPARMARRPDKKKSNTFRGGATRPFALAPKFSPPPVPRALQRPRPLGPGPITGPPATLDLRRPPDIITPATPRWRNWQTHYFEVVAPRGVQVQILSWALARGDLIRGAFF